MDTQDGMNAYGSAQNTFTAGGKMIGDYGNKMPLSGCFTKTIYPEMRTILWYLISYLFKEIYDHILQLHILAAVFVCDKNIYKTVKALYI